MDFFAARTKQLMAKQTQKKKLVFVDDSLDYFLCGLKISRTVRNRGGLVAVRFDRIEEAHVLSDLIEITQVLAHALELNQASFLTTSG